MQTPQDTVGSGGSGTDGRGQSEVIAVILLVAIVVVLVAVAGQFVFGLDVVQGEEKEVGPSVAFTTTADGGDLTIEHQTGAALDTSELTVLGTEEGDFGVDWDDQSVEDEWEAGETITVSPDSGETVRIVWESSSSDESTVVFEETFDP